MIDVYEKCPVLEGSRFQLRFVENKDAKDLYQVYGDKKALPFFNSDNCHGCIFYCPKLKDVEETITYWTMEYNNKGFVRWSIMDQEVKKVIGTIELFHRESNDYFNDCGLLRLDVASDYEMQTEMLKDILSIIIEPTYRLFDCSMIATKAAPYAVDRIQALKETGFVLSEEKLVGYDGTEYRDYWVRMKN